MKISLEEIHAWERKYRLKFINSLSGYKAVHLVGTRSAEGQNNLALFNSVVHIASEPPLVGLVMRPLTVERHTYENIKETGVYTINHVHQAFLEQAHYTSAKFPRETSEFDACKLSPHFEQGLAAPYVKESFMKFAVKFVEEHKIKANGGLMVVGEIQQILIDDKAINADGQLDLEAVADVCVTGLNQYSVARKHKHLPYARPEDLPLFNSGKKPDNVVFDEESQSYNAHILPYGTNIGAPSIQVESISNWKKKSLSDYNHSLGNKIETIKREYEELVDEHRRNERLYNAKMNFEPVVGEVYHLYFNDKKGEEFLSLIPPETWKSKTFLGSFILNHQKVWEDA